MNDKPRLTQKEYDAIHDATISLLDRSRIMPVGEIAVASNPIKVFATAEGFLRHHFEVSRKFAQAYLVGETTPESRTPKAPRPSILPWRRG